MVKKEGYVQQNIDSAIDNCGTDKTAVRSLSVGENGNPINGSNPLPVTDGSVKWNLITPIFNSTSDVYQFYLDSVLVQTTTINYTDSTKAFPSSITKV